MRWKNAQAIAERSVVLRESEIVLAMLKEGMSIEVIAKITGHSKEEIEALERGK